MAEDAAESGAPSPEGAFEVLDDHTFGRVLDMAGPEATVDLGLASQALAERTLRLRPAVAHKVLALRIKATPAPRLGALLRSPWSRAALAHQGEISIAHKGLRVSHADATFAALAAAGRIKALRLVNCNFQSNKAMAALQRSALPARLERLEINACGLRGDAVEELLHASSWPRLRHLDLAENHLGARGLASVCHASHLRGLTNLSVADNDLGHRDLWPLARAHHLKSR